ncbi:MAG: WXG100 family type VII secretion target [Clostridia bacterium]|nr:WXG100 family type VII secretion target [Clostridia bacterium]
MAEFTVTISSMNEAATSIATQSEEFRTALQELMQATEDLTEKGSGWDDEASVIFREKISELRAWGDTMSQIIDEYSSALNTVADTYVSADEEAAKNFKR